MSDKPSLATIEALLADIERLDAETKGQFRQAEDMEAKEIVTRIMRKIKRNKPRKS